MDSLNFHHKEEKGKNYVIRRTFRLPLLAFGTKAKKLYRWYVPRKMNPLPISFAFLPFSPNEIRFHYSRIPR